MNLIIASDIHGSAFYCKQLTEAIEKEKADRILLLGDILYHGPRNNIPKDYSPQNVAEMLNKMKEKILCVRGNCDAEVDQMMLQFPVMSDYAVIATEEFVIYATHGHVYNEQNLPPIQKGNILLCGHTHVPACREYKEYTYMNPGSVSIPKEESHQGYIICCGNNFKWKDFSGNVIKEYSKDL